MYLQKELQKFKGGWKERWTLLQNINVFSRFITSLTFLVPREYLVTVQWQLVISVWPTFALPGYYIPVAVVRDGVGGNPVVNMDTVAL